MTFGQHGSFSAIVLGFRKGPLDRRIWGDQWRLCCNKVLMDRNKLLLQQRNLCSGMRRVNPMWPQWKHVGHIRPCREMALCPDPQDNPGSSRWDQMAQCGLSGGPAFETLSQPWLNTGPISCVSWVLSFPVLHHHQPATKTAKFMRSSWVGLLVGWAIIGGRCWLNGGIACGPEHRGGGLICPLQFARTLIFPVLVFLPFCRPLLNSTWHVLWWEHPAERQLTAQYLSTFRGDVSVLLVP